MLMELFKKILSINELNRNKWRTQEDLNPQPLDLSQVLYPVELWVR